MFINWVSYIYIKIKYIIFKKKIKGSNGHVTVGAPTVQPMLLAAMWPLGNGHMANFFFLKTFL